MSATTGRGAHDVDAVGQVDGSGLVEVVTPGEAANGDEGSGYRDDMSVLTRPLHKFATWLADRTDGGEWMRGLDQQGRAVLYRRLPRRFADRDKLDTFMAALEVGNPETMVGGAVVEFFGGEHIGTRYNRQELTRETALLTQSLGGRKGRNRLGLILKQHSAGGNDRELIIIEAWDTAGPQRPGPVTIGLGAGVTIQDAEWVAKHLDDHTEPLTSAERRRGVAVLPVDDAVEAVRKREDRALQVRSAVMGGLVGGVLGFAGAVVAGLVTGS